MVLGDLRSLDCSHIFIMVSEGRRVFSGRVVTRHLGFHFGILVELLVVGTCFDWMHGRSAQSRVSRSFPLAVAVGERIAC